MSEMGLSYANNLKSHPEWELLTRRSFPASKLNLLQYGDGPITFAGATTIGATGYRAGTSLTPCSGYLRHSVSKGSAHDGLPIQVQVALGSDYLRFLAAISLSAPCSTIAMFYHGALDFL